MSRQQEQGVDAVARHTAAGLSRRASVLALGGAALAALTASPASAKGGNDNGKKARKQGKKACQRQGAQCRALVIDSCNGEEECVDDQLRCCAFFARCQAGQGFACFTN